MADKEFRATWELGQWIALLRKRAGVDFEELAKAGGPAGEQQEGIEDGDDRVLSSTIIDQYTSAFTELGSERDGSLFAALVLACGCQTDADASERLAAKRQKFEHSAFLVGSVIGRGHESDHDIYGHRIELDPYVSDVLTEAMRDHFVYGLTEIARHYKGLVLARGPQPEHPELGRLPDGWMETKPVGVLRHVGIVPMGGQSGPMYPFDPIAGVITIIQAANRAKALGARRDDVIPVAWAILMANSCVRQSSTALEAWSELSARGPDGFAVDCASGTFNAASGLAEIKGQLPDPARIWRASTELLTPWRDDYVLASWDASLQPGSTGAELGVERRAPITSKLEQSLWVYDDSHYSTTLTSVLADQGITCATITDTALTVHEPQSLRGREPIYWIPTAGAGRALLRKASHSDWYAAHV